MFSFGLLTLFIFYALLFVCFLWQILFLFSCQLLAATSNPKTLYSTQTVYGLHFYCAFLLFQLLKAHHITSQHSPIHTLTAGGLSTKSQPAHQVNIHTHSHSTGAEIGGSFGVQYLAQGRFDMQTGGVGNQTTDLLRSRQLTTLL